MAQGRSTLLSCWRTGWQRERAGRPPACRSWGEGSPRLPGLLWPLLSTQPCDLGWGAPGCSTDGWLEALLPDRPLWRHGAQCRRCWPAGTVERQLEAGLQEASDHLLLPRWCSSRGLWAFGPSQCSALCLCRLRLCWCWRGQRQAGWLLATGCLRPWNPGCWWPERACLQRAACVVEPCAGWLCSTLQRMTPRLAYAGCTQLGCLRWRTRLPMAAGWTSYGA